MKFLKESMKKAFDFIEKRPFLKRFKPLLEAQDEILFGTDKVTKIAPHIMDRLDIKRYMSIVIFALLPAAAAGVYFYGLRVIAVILVSYIVGGLTEMVFSVVRKKPLYEGFLVTGMIFPLILPPTIPLWMVAIGIAFGTFFGKEVFGGTGRNIFNPALVGRVFISMSFPGYFATMWQEPLIRGWGGIIQFASDAVTSATPLISFKGSQILTELPPLLFGASAGSIGETFRIGIILGGLLLIVTKIADWRIPFSYLLTVFVFSFFAHGFMADQFAPPLFQLLSGGLLFGAFFMATDPVTSPLTSPGRWIYGILLGILTVLIRGLSGFAEGVMFAILLMNALAPLIDNLVINTKFKKIGYEQQT